MAAIEIKKNSKEGEKVDSACRECKRSTKHMVLCGITLKGSLDREYDNFQWYDEYHIVQCQGCETIAFRKTHENSE